MTQPTIPAAGTDASGVVVEVPEAEPLVGPWRARHDSSAALGVPAHVTVLFPFLAPEDIGPGTMHDLGELAAGIDPFPARLTAVASFADAVVYLVPEPTARFRALTDAVWARFPDHPPYEGRFDDVVPHLTVADSTPGPGHDLRTQVDAALGGRLPLRFRVEALSLLVSRGGRWAVAARFPLGGHASSVPGPAAEWPRSAGPDGP